MTKHRPNPRHSHHAGSLGLLETLEPRMLLSAGDSSGGLLTPPPGYTETIQWHGAPVTVKTGSWLLSFNDYLGSARAQTTALAAAAELGVSADSVQVIGRGRWATLQTTGSVTEAAVARATASVPGLTGIEPNYIYQSDALPNDTLFTSQWWHDNTGQFFGQAGVIGADIHTPEAWDTTIGSQSVIVAVIDTGVQLDHPDLAANIWHNPGEIAGNGVDDDGNGFIDDATGWDFGDLDNDPDPHNTPGLEHGTWVAGCIGAVGNNGIGVAGVAWSVSILPLKIADKYGALTDGAIVGAHEYATMMRLRSTNIVASNNSYGAYLPSFYKDTPAGSNAEKDSIQAFIDSGGTFVAAAGNSARNNDDPNVSNFPSSYNIPGIIAVAATDNTDGLAGFSSYGAETVDLGAPGEATLTTQMGSTYGAPSGTSFSSPITAGAVALLKTFKPNASPVELRQALIDGVDPLPALQGRVVSGGRLNVARSLQIIGLEGPVLRAVSPGPVTSQTDINTGQVIRSITVTFNKAIDPAALAGAGAGAVQLRRDGTDNIFNTGDDQVMIVSSIIVSPTDPKSVIITLNLAGSPLQRFPLDKYRLTLAAAAFKDTNGNFLNGNSSSGSDQTYFFDVVVVTAGNETNDTLLTSTQTTFNTSGTAVFTSSTIGNGLAGPRDVDIYRIDLARGGLITAEIKARRLPVPSALDSVLRLFNAAGTQIALNDQFYGSDSYIDFFVTTGGTYYIGVSGFGNSQYSPTIAGSGTIQSTGNYDLTIGVQMVGDDHITGTSTLPQPKPIPPTGTQGTTTDTITINDSRQILDINLRLTATHQFRSDLIISLISPTGTTIALVNRRGGSGQDFGDPNQGTNLFLDDEATTPISTLSSAQPGSGAFRPDTPLSSFDGQSALGVWTIVLNDTTALNNGFLYSWSLEFTLSNNIFGPFESNDTIVTARDLTQITPTGSGATTRDAKIGDGGFGVFDRDLFRFTVAAGATLNATVTPTAPAGSPVGTVPSLNSALRLFDASGVQITLSNPTDSKESGIENLIFKDAGTYYLAVSESSNVTYNPFNPTSGIASATTGDYTLTVSVAAGVSDAAHALTGTSLDAGINPSGTLQSNPGVVPGSGSGKVGLRWNDIEFLFDEGSAAPRPHSYFGASAGGIGFINQDTNGQGGNPITSAQLPLAIVDQSDAFNRRVVGTGLFGNLRVERSLSYGINDSFAAFDVVLTNLGATPLSSVSWMEGFNPDPGLNLFPKIPDTRNDVDNTNPLATARFVNNEFLAGLTIGLGAPASDSRATATVVSNFTTLRDSAQLLSMPVNDPNGISSDSQLALAFNLGELGPAGAISSSVHVRYFVFFGNNPADVAAMYASLNNGTGTGHLAVDPATPASETILQPDGQTTTSIPMLPYREYYPEGFANFSTYTFVPILNPSEESNHIVVIARYEKNPLDPTAIRDQVISDFVLAPASRGGITITDPSMYANNTLLVRKDVPYALEIRSQTPVAATFSHYDTFLLSGGRAAIGEAFTTRVSADWTFSQVTKSPDLFSGTSDFVLFMNTSSETIKVDTTFYSKSGAAPITLTQQLEPYRRGGWNINDLPQLAGGDYGVMLSADGPIVAALSHYDRDTASAAGLTGSPTAGSTSGVIPEGQLGLGSTSEKIGILNPNGSTATVTFSFLLSGGSTYRHVMDVAGNRNAVLDVGSLPQFPAGQTYSILYESTLPVSLSLESLADGEGLGTGFSDRAYSYWGFGEGFRPPSAPDGFNNVSESLHLFNPSSGDVLAEITIRFDNNLGQETFRQVIHGRRSLDLNILDMVTGTRRDVLAFYGITVKTATPIVAAMDHYDRYFPGAFSTLGTPLGLSMPVA